MPNPFEHFKHAAKKLKEELEIQLEVLHRRRVTDKMIADFAMFFLLSQILTKKWGEVRQLVPQRDGTLQAEFRKQQSKDCII